MAIIQKYNTHRYAGIRRHKNIKIWICKNANKIAIQCFLCETQVRSWIWKLRGGQTYGPPSWLVCSTPSLLPRFLLWLILIDFKWPFLIWLTLISFDWFWLVLSSKIVTSKYLIYKVLKQPKQPKQCPIWCLWWFSSPMERFLSSFDIYPAHG